MKAALAVVVLWFAARSRVFFGLFESTIIGLGHLAFFFVLCDFLVCEMLSKESPDPSLDGCMALPYDMHSMLKQPNPAFIKELKFLVPRGVSSASARAGD